MRWTTRERESLPTPLLLLAPTPLSLLNVTTLTCHSLPLQLCRRTLGRCWRLNEPGARHEGEADVDLQPAACVRASSRPHPLPVHLLPQVAWAPVQSEVRRTE
jgi:hypothetical protein